LAQVAQAAPYDDFFDAIAHDKESALVNLIFRGFDVNVQDPKGRSGLYMATAEGSFKVAKVLLDWNKTDVNLLTPQNESPLMMAALKGHTALAKQIIARGGDVNKTGWTPLHYAATGGHLEIIRLLLEENAYIDAESPNGSTPLMMAAMYGTAEAARLLMEEGADATLKNEKGLTAIDFAQIAKRDDVAQAIGKTIRLKEPGLAPLPSDKLAPAFPIAPAKEPAKPALSAQPAKPEPEIKFNFEFESQKATN
jgi:ankyrin repeat protein